MSAAGNALGWITGIKAGTRGSEGILFSADAIAWEEAAVRPFGRPVGGPLGRHGALTATADGFEALVPTCETSECRRRGLSLWSSPDGLTWGRASVQPEMPEGVEDFIDVDMAAFGRVIDVVATSGYSGPHRAATSPRSALLSPPLTDAAPAETAAAMVVSLPPADAAPLPDTVATPAGRIAYVAGLNGRRRNGSDSCRRTPARTRHSPRGQRRAGRPTVRASPTRVAPPTTSRRRRSARWTWPPRPASASSGTAGVRGGRRRQRVDRLQPVAHRHGGRLGPRPGDRETRVPLAGADPQWSPDGSWVMVTTGSGVPYVTVVRPDGSDAASPGTRLERHLVAGRAADRLGLDRG